MSVLKIMRRIGPYPAPHEETEIDIEVPKEFFSGEVPLQTICIEEHSGQELEIPGGNLASSVATARYGSGDTCTDVMDIVKRELLAGKPVTATNELFGDPCP